MYEQRQFFEEEKEAWRKEMESQKKATEEAVARDQQQGDRALWEMREQLRGMEHERERRQRERRRLQADLDAATAKKKEGGGFWPTMGRVALGIATLGASELAVKLSQV